MFQNIQRRLLFSYLLVFTSILVTFALGVRIIFTRILTQQLIEELTILGQSAVADVEFSQGHLQIEIDFISQNLIEKNQALQWFDLQGNLLGQQGNNTINLPLEKNKSVQFQTQTKKIKAVTLPVINGNNSQIVGYVRASESLQEFDQTLEKLDWGLGSAILLALILCGSGGIILTRQAMQPIKESFQRLKQFTADASHELRSPLMVIKSNVGVALKYPEGMRQTDLEKFEAIASATKQMTRLTEDLLLLARTDRSSDCNWEIINLNSLLHQLFEQYQSQAQAKQIELKEILQDSLYIQGDAGQLSRLFGNLIDNALYYTPSQGIIEIKAKRINSYICISIQDTGIGIAPEHLEKIFERFWRADTSRSHWNGGSGLGLAIAKAIAIYHRGSITVSSKLGIGSCFTVHIPVFYQAVKP